MEMPMSVETVEGYSIQLNSCNTEYSSKRVDDKTNVINGVYILEKFAS